MTVLELIQNGSNQMGFLGKVYNSCREQRLFSFIFAKFLFQNTLSQHEAEKVGMLVFVYM